jgi:phosphoketolase
MKKKAEKKETKLLPCALTQQELLERGQRAAELVNQIASEEEVRSAAGKASKEKINGFEIELRAVGYEIRTKKEMRDVEIERVKDLGRKVEEVIRLDTGEIVETRALAPHELQAEMAL